MVTFRLMVQRERDSSRNPERFIPAVFRIMRIQSDPVKSAILVGLRDAASEISVVQLHGVVRDSLENTPTSSFSHSLKELENENLLMRGGRRNLRVTELGRVSVEALKEFQVNVFPHLLKSHLRRLEAELGTDTASEFARKFEVQEESGRFRFLPVVLRLIKIGSDTTRLEILQALRERGSLSFRGLLLAVETHLGSRVPSSTLSNLLNELSYERLLDKQPKGSVIQLTDMGETVLSGFEQFHQRLQEPVLQAFREKFERDFGQ